MTVEDCCRVLEKLAEGHAIEMDGEYTWIDRKTLRIAAAVMRRMYGDGVSNMTGD